MFKFFKKKKPDKPTDISLLSKTASLLIHAAKIDENYTNIEKSIIKPSPTACPPKLVPPPLGVIDISLSKAYNIICCKSSFDLGKATPIGII